MQMAIATLEEMSRFEAVLDLSRPHLEFVAESSRNDSTSIGSANTSPDPYFMNDKLFDFLLEAQTKAVESLQKVDEMALKGLDGLVPIERDLSLKQLEIIFKFQSDHLQLVQAIRNADNSVRSAIASGGSQLAEVEKMANEANSDFVLRIFNVQYALNLELPFPLPPFSAWLSNFMLF